MSRRSNSLWKCCAKEYCSDYEEYKEYEEENNE